MAKRRQEEAVLDRDDPAWELIGEGEVPVRDLDTAEASGEATDSTFSLDTVMDEAIRAIPQVPAVAPEPEFRAEEARPLEIASAPTQKLRIQFRMLRDGGVFGDVDTSGANSLMMAVDLTEAGAWRSQERDARRRLSERNPQVSVLPQYWVGRLSNPLKKARLALRDHSYRFPVTDAFVGPSFRFIPWTRWRDFIAAYRAAQEDLERVKDELLAPDATGTRLPAYEEAVAAVLEQAEKRAEHAARSLEANGTPVTDDFIPTFVGRVAGRVPSPQAIRSRLRIGFTPGLLEDEAEVLDAEARLAEARANLERARATQDTVAETKAEMRAFILEEVRDRLRASMAPFDQMVLGFKREAYRTMVRVREALTANQALDTAALRRVEALFTELAKIKEFLGDEFRDGRLEELVAQVTAFGTASAKTGSPLLAGQLEQVMADLQAECRDAAEALEGEDTGARFLA